MHALRPRPYWHIPAAPPFFPTCPSLAPAAGLPSAVREVQALSLDTSAKLVKAAGPELVRPHMPLLVPAMLESLRWVRWALGA